MSGKRNRKTRKGRQKKASSNEALGKRRAVTPRRVRAAPDLTALWDERRAGARNVAGVTYQIAVTAHLLVAGRAGALPVRAVTPEGLEDVDCELRPSEWDASRLFVQCKERAAGEASFGMADVADFLAHALEAVGGETNVRVALVTDAAFGADLPETGWDATAFDGMTPEATERLAEYLPDVGVEAVLKRTHLVRIPFDVVPTVSLATAQAFDLVPVIAGLVVARLIQDLASLAAGQRARPMARSGRRTTDDLAPLVADILRVADSTSLMDAELARVITPLDFLNPLQLEPEAFLAGVDVRPGHIAAELDVPRPTELKQIFDGLEASNVALIIGPSGAGKSALLWRAAAALSGFIRPFRLHSCRREDARAILDYVDALAPSPTTPILICVDDLGREPTSGWEAVAAALLERPGVHLLGAAREEDFTPSLAVRRATLVRPTLDRSVAYGINAVLASRGITAAVSVDEAFDRSDRLLMEFLTILITGDRVSQVVGEQVHALLGDDRGVEREVLRWISAAHMLGTSLPATTLGSLVRARDLPQALDRLKLEHFILEEAGTSWCGLHELRSEVATRVIHETPPPDVITTWAQLLAELPRRQRRHLPARIARISDNAASLDPVATSIGTVICNQDLDGPEVAELVASLKEAETVRHAAACLASIRGFGPPKMDVVDLLYLLAAKRFRGIDVLGETGSNIDPVYYRMSDALPERPALREEMLRQVEPSLLIHLTESATTSHAAALLEALEGTSVRFDIQSLRAVLRAHSSAPVRPKARLVATLVAHGLTTADVEQALGGASSRLETLRNEDLVVRRCDLTEENGTSVAIVTMVTIPQPDANPHGEAVDMARVILDLCPDVDVAEVVMLGVDGERYRQAGLEPAHKRLTREALPRVPATEEIGGLVRAAHELIAASYWTERLREQAALFELLRRLVEDVPQRLLDARDAGRQRWRADVEALRTRAAALPTAPLPRGLEVRLSEKERRDRDPSREALQAAANALGQLATELPNLPAHRLHGIAAQLRRAAQELLRAYSVGGPTLADVGDPLPRDVHSAVTDAAALLVLLAQDPALDDLPRTGARNAWQGYASQLLRRSREGLVSDERAAIESTMVARGVTGKASLVGAPPDQLPSTDLIDEQWVVTVDVAEWDGGSFLESVQGDAHPGLSGRVVALPTLGDFALPTGGVALTTSGIVGLTSREVQYRAAAVGLGVYAPPLYRTVVESIPDLMRASAYVAAGQVGQPSETDAAAREVAPQLLEQVRSALRDCPVPEIAEAWEALCAGVEEEINGQRNDGLAIQTARVVRGEPPGDQVIAMQRVLAYAALSPEDPQAS